MRQTKAEAASNRARVASCEASHEKGEGESWTGSRREAIREEHRVFETRPAPFKGEERLHEGAADIGR